MKRCKTDVVRLGVAGHAARVLPNVEPHERLLSEGAVCCGLIVCTCRPRSIRRTSEELVVRRQQGHVASYRTRSSKQNEAEDMMWAPGSILEEAFRPGSVACGAR